MDHRQIDEENVAERYVTGRLSSTETAAFEEHFLDCPECCARVDAAQRLERGLHKLAEEAAADLPRGPRLARWSRSPWPALAAAALLLALLLPAWLGVREIRRLRNELTSARQALARPPAGQVDPGRLSALDRELQDTRRELAAETERRATLAREIEAARQPLVNLGVLALTPVRGGLEGPVRTLTLPRVPGWIALWAEPGDTGFPAYRATFRSRRGDVVFQAGRLKLNDLGALLFMIHSSTLAAGDYRVEIDGLPRDGPPVAAGRFPVRAVPPK
jgi:hypothetical protein